MIRFSNLLSRVNLAVLAAAGSLLILIGAFIFQAAGYAPCAMCLWQRWPHAIAIAIGVLFVATPSTIVIAVGRRGDDGVLRAWVVSCRR